MLRKSADRIAARLALVSLTPGVVHGNEGRYKASPKAWRVARLFFASRQRARSKSVSDDALPDDKGVQQKQGQKGPDASTEQPWSPVRHDFVQRMAAGQAQP